jgi:hypothetical protein
VTYFRVFDPSSATQQTLDIRRYQYFDLFPALVLRSGQVERDGTVVLTRPISTPAAQPTVRTRAGRIVPNLDPTTADGEAVTASMPVADVPSTGPRASPSPATERTIMGEKRRIKSKGKTAKSTKHGLRPHELRERQDAFKNADGQPVTPVKPKQV